MIFETEHWRLAVVPKFVRKRYIRRYKQEECAECKGNSVRTFFNLDWEPCLYCNNTGKKIVDVD